MKTELNGLCVAAIRSFDKILVFLQFPSRELMHMVVKNRSCDDGCQTIEIQAEMECLAGREPLKVFMSFLLEIQKGSRWNLQREVPITIILRTVDREKEFSIVCRTANLLYWFPGTEDNSESEITYYRQQLRELMAPEP